MNDSIVDVIIAVDAESMVESLAPGSADNPTVIPMPLVFMMVKAADAVFGQASKELKFKAQTGDIIRWRAASLSLNDSFQVLLYKYHVVRGQELLSPPTPLIMQAKTALPNPATPTKPILQTRKYHFWQATVLMPGEVTYAFYMMVLDNNSKPLGFYYWDPFIAITD